MVPPMRVRDSLIRRPSWCVIMDPEKSDNYYSILECPETATTDDLRRNYKQLALKCHPDKNPDAPVPFSMLSKAVKTLSDETERFKYDSSLLRDRRPDTDKIITEELMINDMERQSDDVLSYDCRCGGQFLLLPPSSRSSDPESKMMIIDCNTCSLSIQVNLTTTNTS